MPRAAARASSRSAVCASTSILRSLGFMDATQRLLIIQKAPQLARPRRVFQFAQRLGLDLADALARHRELLADLFQRVVGVHADAEAHAEYTLLARREQCECARCGLAQVRLDDGVDR